MAKITYEDELPDDSVGKKFQGAVYDTGSANAIAAIKGVNPVTQQGKTVVDQSVAVSTASGAGAAGGLAADAAVTTDATGTRSAYLRGIVTWFARLGSLDGAAFTAGSSYVWPGLAGVYQSTVGTLTAGQRGLARLTERRAVVTAGDKQTANATFVWASDATVKYASLTVPEWAKKAVLLFSSDADQAGTLDLFWQTPSTFGMGVKSFKFYSESAVLSAGGLLRISPSTAATGATSYKVVADLANVSGQYLSIYVTPSSTCTGTSYVTVEWSA